MLHLIFTEKIKTGILQDKRKIFLYKANMSLNKSVDYNGVIENKVPSNYQGNVAINNVFD